MTERERLLILLTADAVIAGALNPCATPDIESLRKARHAMDDEAFRIALGDSTDEARLADGTVIASLRPEAAAAVLERVREAVDGFAGPTWRPDQPITDAMAEHYARDDEACIREAISEALQPLAKALANIITICATNRNGHEEMRSCLTRIETIARNASRWLELRGT